MYRKVLASALLALVACLLTLEISSAPTALAKSRPARQDETSAPPPLPAPPAEWVVSNEIAGAAAVATKAGISGVQHVADCVSFSTVDPGTSGAVEIIQLLDGSSVLMQWVISSPPITSAQGSISVCGLNVVGSVGSAMTLEFTGSSTTTRESVNLVGHDAT